MSWAANIDENGVVIQVIVGDADWAMEHLGGSWIPCHREHPTEQFPGIGWGYAPSHPQRFAVKAPASITTTDGDARDKLPPRSIWWENGQILTIEEISSRRGVVKTVAEAEERGIRVDAPRS